MERVRTALQSIENIPIPAPPTLSGEANRNAQSTLDGTGTAAEVLVRVRWSNEVTAMFADINLKVGAAYVSAYFVTASLMVVLTAI